MERSPRAPVLRCDGLVGNRAERVIGEGQRHALHVEELLVLLHERVLRLDEDLHQRVIIEIVQRGEDRQPADELGDKPEAQQVLRLDLAQDLAGLALVRRTHIGTETDRHSRARAEK